MSLLNSEEIEWINTYHKEVFDKVYPLLVTNDARNWLVEATAEISRN